MVYRSAGVHLTIWIISSAMFGGTDASAFDKMPELVRVVFVVVAVLTCFMFLQALRARLRRKTPGKPVPAVRTASSPQGTTARGHHLLPRTPQIAYLTGKDARRVPICRPGNRGAALHPQIERIPATISVLPDGRPPAAVLASDPDTEALIGRLLRDAHRPSRPSGAPAPAVVKTAPEAPAPMAARTPGNRRATAGDLGFLSSDSKARLLHTLKMGMDEIALTLDMSLPHSFSLRERDRRWRILKHYHAHLSEQDVVFDLSVEQPENLSPPGGPRH